MVAGVRAGALAAETVGTFVFVWIGTGTVLATQQLSPGPLQDTPISVAFGFALMAAVYATAGISGAHLNPAVSVALAAVRQFPWRAVPSYVAAQFVGAFLAALANWVLFGGHARTALILGATRPGPRGPGVALLAEFIITFLLMVIIMATAVDRRTPGPVSAGLAIGLVVGAGIFAALPVSGGSFNPARTLGPMIVSAQFPGWWVYIVGPTAGALAGAVCWRSLISHGKPPGAE
jgi:MIP family channel proteins